MLRMSKRLATWLLSPLLALSLPAACGGSSESDGTGGAATGGAGGTGGSGGAGGSSGSGGSTTDGGEYLKCFDATGKFTAYELKTCSGDACALLVHQTDCCGNTLLIGVAEARLAELQACETAWRATLPDCQCPAGPPQIEQPGGTTVNDPSGAEVGCINWTSSGGICLTQPKK
jgi:hypothetical protein